jgi:tetratricopeptide (TPR) repeat protein
MRSFVLSDPRLRQLESQYVFAAVNSEHEVNAAFVRLHPISAWPTFLVFAPGDAADAQPKLVWAGTTTAPELVDLLRAAAAAPRQEADSVQVASTLVARGNHAGAIAVASVEFARLAELARTGAAEVRGRRARIMELLAAAYQGAGKREDLIRFAASVGDEPPSTSLATVLVLALGSFSKVTGLTEEMHRVRAKAIALAQGDALLVDDRSSLYEALVEAGAEGAAREADTRALATRWVELLERAAEATQSPSARAVFDAHRVLAYLALGQPARAVPMLERSERDLPDDYNPPARLARVLLEMGKLEEADAAVTRALAKVSGPRELRVAGLAADIAIRRGAPLRALAALERAVLRAKQGALPGSYAKVLVETEARLMGLRDSLSGAR